MSSGPVTTRASFYSMAVATAHAESAAAMFNPAHSWLAGQIGGSAARPYLFDIGCGDGSFLAAMGDMGIFGEGIDISGAFIAMARRKGLKVQQESAVQAPVPAGTTAITALGEVLAYDPPALAPMAHRAARALPSGGVMIFDLPGPDTPESDREIEGEDWRLASVVRIEGNSLIRDIEVNLNGQQVKEQHRQHLFAPEEVRGILEGFGMTAEIHESYGPCPLLPGRFAVLALKP